MPEQDQCQDRTGAKSKQLRIQLSEINRTKHNGAEGAFRIAFNNLWTAIKVDSRTSFYIISTGDRKIAAEKVYLFRFHWVCVLIVFRS